ncbi:MAG: hypothetical protein Q8873_06730 [Bacillota bacterium]|nr:hypothetical protein [Bacillota bacterium]
MNTDFNILWFEDNDEWYSATEDDLKEYIETLCFRPCFTRCSSIPNEEIKDIINDKTYDLVFADLNLDEGKKGNSAIQLIREHNILADALFYSTDGIDKIKTVMKAEALEGVYLSDRGEIFFPKNAKRLIDKAVRRSEDILNVRGMLMDNVSEFDEKLKDTIKKFLSLSGDEEKTKLDKYAYNKVKEQISENTKKIEELKVGFILNALDNSFIIDSYKLSMIVNKIFKDYYPKYTNMIDFHENYKEKVLKERNQLAHSKKEPEANGVFYFIDKDGKRTDYNSAKCRELRLNLNTYNKLLNEVIDVIK